MYTTEDLKGIPLAIVSCLNSYFILLLTKIELLKAYVSTTFETNSNFKLVSTKISNFETRLSKYDPYTIIITFVLLCFALKLVKKFLGFLLSILCKITYFII
jgi:hypothetical protein